LNKNFRILLLRSGIVTKRAEWYSQYTALYIYTIIVIRFRYPHTHVFLNYIFYERSVTNGVIKVVIFKTLYAILGTYIIYLYIIKYIPKVALSVGKLLKITIN
jgi:hypothetical protein